MQIITINLPEKYLEAIQILNDYKIYPSRSEAIRIALERFLTNELKMDKELEEDNFKMLTKGRINKKKIKR
ncbi:MAG: ribbon-helix-helix protein, CopG family [Candidatus Lokiarchaeota archaeon]|nr:ribbon-helix-helix protein, CopG family [Candidatus Lokiarchaeota archaeon]